MLFRLAVPLVLVAGLVVACDSRDFEAEIAELQAALESAKEQVENSVTENETLNEQVAALEGQLEEAKSAGASALESVKGGLDEAATSAEDALNKLDVLADQGQDEVSEAAAALREDLSTLLERLQVAAADIDKKLGGDAGAEEAESASP